MAAVPLTREDLHNGPGKEKLPQELRDAERDDTVCKYCGVAYLVFSEIKELEKRLRAAEAKMKESERKVAEYDSMQDQLRTAQRQAQTASAALEEATEDRDMLTRQLADAKEDAERARVESEARWKRRLEDLQARAEADKKRAVDAKALEVQALLSRESLVGKGHLMRMQEYKQKTREMATVLEAQRKSLKAMRDAVVAQRDDILNLVGAAQNESGTIHRIVRRLREEKGLLQSERDDARAAHDGTRTQLIAARDKCATLDAELQTLRNSASSAQTELQRQYDAAQKVNSDLLKEREDLSDQLRQTKASLQEAAARRDELQRELAAVNQTAGSSQRETASLKQTVNELREQLSSLRARYEELQRTAAKRARDAAQAASQLQGDAASRQASLEADLAAANAAVARLRQELHQAQAARIQGEEAMKRQFARDLADTEQQWTSKHADVSHLLDARNRELQQEQSRTQQLNADLSQARSAMQAKEAEVRLMRDQLGQLQQELQRARGQSGEADRLRASLAHKEHALREAEEESGTLINQLLRAQQELKDCQVELETAKQQISEAATTTAKVSDLEGMERHLIKLSNQLRQKDTEISHLEATVHKECEEREYYMEKLQRLQESLGMVKEQRGHAPPPAAPRSTLRAPSPISTAPSGGVGAGEADSAMMTGRSNGSSASASTWSRRGRGGTNRGRRGSRRFR